MLAGMGKVSLFFVVYATSWAVLGIPLLRWMSLRYPLTMARLPVYVAVGVQLTAVSAGLAWLTTPNGRALAQAVLTVVGSLWMHWLAVALTHVVAEKRRHDEELLRETALRGQLARARLQALQMQL